MAESAGPSEGELARVKLFLGVQVIFLLISPLTGGFHFSAWSMLDTALLIQAIGITGLVPVLEEKSWRKLAFRAAIVFYVAGILDMGVNVLVSGVAGWRSIL
ncbi:MAG: hypothetical protein AAF533_09755 [Acidobacteriota bacterium]